MTMLHSLIVIVSLICLCGCYSPQELLPLDPHIVSLLVGRAQPKLPLDYHPLNLLAAKAQPKQLITLDHQHLNLLVIRAQPKQLVPLDLLLVQLHSQQLALLLGQPGSIPARLCPRLEIAVGPAGAGRPPEVFFYFLAKKIVDFRAPILWNFF
jgi:hypothetical protein